MVRDDNTEGQDDLSLKYLHPDVYYDLAEKISLKKDEREEEPALLSAERKYKLSRY